MEEKQRQDSDNRRLHERVQKLEAYNATLEKVCYTYYSIVVANIVLICIGADVCQLQNL